METTFYSELNELISKYKVDVNAGIPGSTLATYIEDNVIALMHMTERAGITA